MLYIGKLLFCIENRFRIFIVRELESWTRKQMCLETLGNFGNARDYRIVYLDCLMYSIIY